MRKLLLIALLGLSYCAPAYAGAHGEDNNNYGLYESEEAANSFMNVIPGRKTITDGEYRVMGAGQESPMTVKLVLRETHYADVIFKNEIAPAWLQHEGVEFHTEDGKVVIVMFHMRNGDIPDTFTVLPPNGYIAIPAEMTVDDGAVGIIEIHEATLG